MSEFVFIFSLKFSTKKIIFVAKTVSIMSLLFLPSYNMYKRMHYHTETFMSAFYMNKQQFLTIIGLQMKSMCVSIRSNALNSINRIRRVLPSFLILIGYQYSLTYNADTMVH